MANEGLARRTDVEFAFDGFDMSDIMAQYYTSFTYSDCEEDESDSIEITLQDRNMTWMREWLPDIIDKAAAGMLTMSATIVRRYQDGGSSEERLPCGTFELDEVSLEGPPASVTLSGVSLPYSSKMRQGVNTKTWENYTLSGIAGEIAANSGLSLLYDAGFDPLYDEKEQKDQSDINFLQRLCQDAYVTIKISDGKLILFDASSYEEKEAVASIYYGTDLTHLQYGEMPGGITLDLTSVPDAVWYTQYEFHSSSADVQYDSCRVSYVDPWSGTLIEGIAYTEDYQADLDSTARENAEITAKNAEKQAKSSTATLTELKTVEQPRQLEVTMKVSSAGSAEWYAAKLLKLHNKYAKTASFTLIGAPNLVAGVTVNVRWFGGFSGKYYVYKAEHSVSPSSGYTTKVELRYVCAIG